MAELPSTVKDRLRTSRAAPALRAGRDRIRRLQALRRRGRAVADGGPSSSNRSGREQQAEQLARQSPDQARLLQLEATVAGLRRRLDDRSAAVGTTEPSAGPPALEPQLADLLRRRLVGDRHLGGAGVVPGSLVEADTAAGSMLLPGYDGYIVPQLIETGVWEPEEHELMLSVLRPGMTVVDIGAHVGFHTLCAAQAVGPSGRVVALEASPTNFALLCANVDRNRADNVIPIAAAAAERSGEVELTLSHENSGGNRAYRLDYVEPSIVVPAVRIDDIFPPDAKVDLVKVDIEGMDHRALAGMRELLARCQPIVITEFFPEWIFYLGDDPIGVLEQYRSLGYRLRPLIGDGPGNLSDEALVERAATSGTGYVTLVLEPT